MAFHITRNGFKLLSNVSEPERAEIIANIKAIFDQCNPALMYVYPAEVGDTPPNVESRFKKDYWKVISTELFAIFWLLTLENIYFPSEIYEQEIKRIQENIDLKEKDKEKEIERLKSNKEKLRNEADKYKKRREAVDGFLHGIKDSLNNLNKENLQSFTPLFVQTCLLPRMLIEPQEALYACKFLFNLYKIKKVQLQSVIVQIYETMLLVLPCLQFSSYKEAQNISVFLLELLSPLEHWNDREKIKLAFKNIFDLQLEDKSFDKIRTYILFSVFNKFKNTLLCLKATPQQTLNCLVVLMKLKDIFPCIQSQAIEL